MTSLNVDVDPAFEAVVRDRLAAVETRLKDTAAAQPAVTTAAAPPLLAAAPPATPLRNA